MISFHATETVPGSLYQMGAEKKWIFALFSAAFVTLLIFLSTICGFNSSYYAFSSNSPLTSSVHRGPGHPPSFAYYISGGHGDGDRIFRLFLAVYHPRNRYLLHIGADGSDAERRKLASMVNSLPVVRSFGNADVIGRPDPVTYMGSTNIAAVLRAASISLKLDNGWDWFITLSAVDYPLMTQDGMIQFWNFFLFLFINCLCYCNCLLFYLKFRECSLY